MLRRVLDIGQIGLATGLVLGLGYAGYVSSTEPSISRDVKKFDSTPNEIVFVFDSRNPEHKFLTEEWKWKPFADSREKEN